MKNFNSIKSGVIASLISAALISVLYLAYELAISKIAKDIYRNKPVDEESVKHNISDESKGKSTTHKKDTVIHIHEYIPVQHK